MWLKSAEFQKRLQTQRPKLFCPNHLYVAKQSVELHTKEREFLKSLHRKAFQKMAAWQHLSVLEPRNELKICYSCLKTCRNNKKTPSSSLLTHDTSILPPPTSTLIANNTHITPQTSTLPPHSSLLRSFTSQITPHTSDLQPPTTHFTPHTAHFKHHTTNLCLKEVHGIKCKK